MSDYYISDCCGEPVFYDEFDALHCQACGEECGAVKVPPDKDEIALVKAERRADR